MPEAGIPFGNYQLIKRLARGGMAEVFLARQHGLGGFERRVAVKRILPHLADTPDFVGMFLDEARLAAQLSHPNIVHIYDFGQFEEHYFIAMEFVDGVHAGELIERGAQEKMPAALVARIGADACAGLNYAHNIEDKDGQPLRLVHRDMSPPNLMISLDGVVKLVDFGIAKAVSTVEKTRPGIVKGKFAYMSPEQTMGMKLDGRSDVFSLTLVLWELLAGRVAVDRTDPVGAMTAIRDGRLPSIRQARPDLPSNLAEVIEAGLEVEPTDRLSAVDLGNAFEGFIKSSPELGTSMQLSQWIRQRYRKPSAEAQREGPPDTQRDGERKVRPVSAPSGKSSRPVAAEQPTMTSGRSVGHRRIDSEADRPTRAMAPAIITDENTAIDSSRAYIQPDDDDAPTEIAPADDDGQPTFRDVNTDPTNAPDGLDIHPPMSRPAHPSGGSPPPIQLQAPPSTIPPPGAPAAQLGIETRRPAPASRPPPMSGYPNRPPHSNDQQGVQQGPQQGPGMAAAAPGQPMPGHPQYRRNPPRATGAPGFAGVPMDANGRIWVAAVLVFVLAALIAVALLGDDEQPVTPGVHGDAGVSSHSAPDDSDDPDPTR